MECSYLGTTGTRASNLCFGTWRFGLESDGTTETTREDAHDLLDVSLSDAQFGRIDDAASS